MFCTELTTPSILNTCLEYLKTKETQRNWGFATTSNLLLTVSLQPNVVNLWYFKLWIMLDQRIYVWNIKCIRHWVEMIWKGLENLSFWQRLNSFNLTKYTVQDAKSNFFHFKGCFPNKYFQCPLLSSIGCSSLCNYNILSIYLT